MPFGSSQWMYNSGADFYNGVATQSLRFDIASSSYLKRQPSASNRKTYVVSFWVKPSKDTLNSAFLAGRTGTSGTYTILGFSASDNRIRVTDNQTTYPALETSGKYRDTSAWYHIVFAVDTTQTTTSNTIQVYVNGVEQGLTTSYYYSTNDDTNINSTADHYIGHQAGVSSLDGYLAEYNFIDGLSFFSDTSGTPNTSFNINSFGELKNGVWIAKAYSGSYGTNGFRLAFNSSDLNVSGSAVTDPYGSATDVPNNGLADASGQGNHWTINGISAVDFVPDSPENNWCTFNTLDKDADYTLSEGSLKADSTSSGYGATKSTFAVTSGKWYWEIRLTGTGGRAFIGIAKTTVNPINATNGTADTLFYSGQTGNIWYDGSDQGSYSSTYTTNDIISVALNLDDNEITFYKNGTSAGVAISSIEEGDWTPTVDDGSTTFITSFVANFGQDPSFAGGLTGGDIGTETPSEGVGVFKYAVPSGFKALCTANISDDDLPISPNADTQADDYFDITTWSGDNADTRDIEDYNFQPDWAWIKNRGTISHVVFDSVRGVSTSINTALSTNESDREGLGDTITTSAQLGGISAFLPNGFTLKEGNTDDARYTNKSSNTYVGWAWKAGGTAVTNNQGDIQTQVSANTDAGFSIITYSGSGTAGDTIGHGLNSAPTCIHWKRRNAIGNWMAYFEVLGTGGYLNLDRDNGFDTGASPVNGVAPTNSVITLGSQGTINNSAGTYVCYAFHDVEGFSKFGVYTANTDPDGPMIWTGFRPKFVLIKKSSGTASWWLVDAVRDTYNPTDNYLLPDTGDPDRTYTTADFVSNGFKIRNTSTAFNSGTHVYMAFADSPFKYANGR